MFPFLFVCIVELHPDIKWYCRGCGFIAGPQYSSLLPSPFGPRWSQGAPTKFRTKREPFADGVSESGQVFVTFAGHAHGVAGGHHTLSTRGWNTSLGFTVPFALT